MFFEGSEKKIELVFQGQNLMELGEAFWKQVVACSNAQILSSIKNTDCHAYLLSESSLFVWKDRFVMITCGETTLAKAVTFFIEKMGKEGVAFLIYERKNEYRPENQRSSFEDDVKEINRFLPGSAYQFGQESGHHLYLFHLEQPYHPPTDDVTLEILMYGLDGNSLVAFGGECKSRQQARELTQVDQIFDGFEVDDYLFDPCGYSLNAIRGSEYYTIHVTPQEEGAYVSFETNVRIDHNYLPTLKRVIETFQPESFDVIVFRTQQQEFLEVPGYSLNSAVKHEAIAGYHVNHCEFVSQDVDPQKIYKSNSAISLELKSE